MKKFIAVLSIMTIVLFIFSSCGFQESKTGETTQLFDASEVQAIPETTKPDTDLVSTNQDGVVELPKDSGFALKYCYDKDIDDKYVVVFKHVDSIIPKIPQNATIGIYNDLESIDLLPVDISSPRYTVNLNFYWLYDDKVADHPGRIHYGEWFNNIADKSEINILKSFWDNDIHFTECNNVDFETYVNQNSVIFHYYSVFDGSDDYKLLSAQKNQTFEFGGYKGTQWESFTTKADVEYYSVNAYSDDNVKIKRIQVEKTKNGYFTVDLSALKPGVYYVLEYDAFIELV